MDNLSDYTDAVGSLGNTASGLLNALNGGSKTPAAAPVAAAPAKTNWVLIGGIGAAVVVVLVLIVSMGGRR